jgi:hypothetical protein
VSYDVFVCRFVNGEPASLDQQVVNEVLAPYVTERDPEHGFLHLKAGDGGEADIYANSETSIMINHFGVGEIMDVVADLLKRLEAVLVLPGGTVVLHRAEDRAHLSQSFRDEWSVVVASTGEKITEAIRAS